MQTGYEELDAFAFFSEGDQMGHHLHIQGETLAGKTAIALRIACEYMLSNPCTDGMRHAVLLSSEIQSPTLTHMFHAVVQQATEGNYHEGATEIPDWDLKGAYIQDRLFEVGWRVHIGSFDSVDINDPEQLLKRVNQEFTNHSLDLLVVDELSRIVTRSSNMVKPHRLVPEVRAKVSQWAKDNHQFIITTSRDHVAGLRDIVEEDDIDSSEFVQVSADNEFVIRLEKIRTDRKWTGFNRMRCSTRVTTQQPRAANYPFKAPKVIRSNEEK